MKKRCTMNLVVVAMAATMMCGGLSDAAMSGGSENKQEYVVLLEEDANQQRALSKVEKYGEVVDEITENQERDAIVAELTRTEAEKIEQSNEVALVEKNISFDVSGEVEEIQAIQDVVDSRWNIKMVHGERFSENDIQKKKVAVIDSGVACTSDIHVKEQVDFTDGGDSILCRDMTGHGTAVAGIVGAEDNGEETSGVAQGLEVYSLRVFDEENRASLSRIISALDWCMKNHVDIVNMSFGTAKYSEILERYIQDAKGQGMLLIGAVGNKGGAVEYPAAYREVMGVGSVDSNGKVSDFNAMGEELEILAPGENVPISQSFGFSSVGSGTSYAAAHVTAVAALLWNENPNWSCDKIRGLIDSSANVLYRDEGRGWGLLDYAYARNVMKDFSVKYDENGTDEEIRYYDSREEFALYDLPEEVKASWKSTGHDKTIVNSGASAKYTSKKLDVLKKVNAQCDLKENIGQSGGVNVIGSEIEMLHAHKNTNYVAVAKYLYEVALYQKKNLDIPITDVMNKITYKGTPRTLIEKPYKGYTDLQMLKKAVNVMCKLNITKAYGTSVADKGKERALRTLGMALHVAGDAYAHKAVIPDKITFPSDISKELSRSIQDHGIKPGRKDEFDIERPKGITSSRWDYYSKQDTKISHEEHADEPKWLPQRFQKGAMPTVNLLMSKYYQKENYSVNFFYHPEDKVCQYRLYTYVNQAKGNEALKSDWKNYSRCD